MPTLHLGVVDVPYARAVATATLRTARWRYQKRPWQSFGSLTKTGDVAEILEAKYGLFSMFYLLRGADVNAAIEEAYRGRLETALMGGPVPNGLDVPPSELSKIETAFRDFLDARELDGRAPGVPTAASLRGVNHRLAHPYSRNNPSRPSFVDTGTLQATFTAWIDA